MCWSLCAECVEFLSQRRSGAVLTESRKTNSLQSVIFPSCPKGKLINQSGRNEMTSPVHGRKDTTNGADHLSGKTQSSRENEIGGGGGGRSVDV